MGEHPAYISRDGRGKVKLEYSCNGEQLVRLWENRGDNTLETLFDSSGSILMQRVAELKKEELDSKVSETISAEKITKTVELEYMPILLDRPCPKCGAQFIPRYAEVFASREEVPIMPLYWCKECRTTSYRLTDSYLEYLVENNWALFDGMEKKELEADRDKFMSELKSYIIRIFASKKIMCIK